MVRAVLALAAAAGVAAHKMDDHDLDMAKLHRKLAELECGNSAVWYKNGDTGKDCEWAAQWQPRCDAKGWDGTFASESCPEACGLCVPSTAPTLECPAVAATFDPPFGSIIYDAAQTISRANGATTIDAAPTVQFASLGSITALIPEASDSLGDPALTQDGMSGDIDFPHGKIKALATVGEVFNGLPLAGVPDGMGAYLLDADTIRIIVQSESYGMVSQYESYPWFVDGSTDIETDTASYTGSHLQFGDIDRAMFANWMDSDMSAEPLFKDFGNMIEKAYNLKGELVGPRNKTGATTVGAHYSNLDADGNYVLQLEGKYADWLMQSLCSASLSEPYMWGAGIGSVDRIYMTNEEWMTYASDATAAVGLSAHAIDTATKTAWAIGVFMQGGFEKTIEIDVGHPDYVAWAISGYNGDFSSASLLSATLERRNAMYSRADGKPFVWSENIHPARVYIGKKGYDVNGAPSDSFLARNGLEYGKVYGFACDPSVCSTRDAWHKVNYNGATVEGVFAAVNWTWTGEVVNFEHDGAFEFQDAVPGQPETMAWWNANGPDASGAKCEHLSNFFDGTASYIQSSTAGYFGKYTLEGLGDLLAMYADGLEMPAAIPSTYRLYQGETDVVDQIELGGKGVVANGELASTHFERVRIEENGTYTILTAKTTFEDIDGFETIAAADGDYVIFQEDSGNDFGDRTFITPLKDGVNLTHYFIAQSGGEANTRMVAGVGVPAGSNPMFARAHEFSGIIDLSGMLAKDAEGFFVLQEGYAGYERTMAAKSVPINDKYIMFGLQAHNLISGAVNLLSADRGGQWLVYQPALPEMM